MFKAMLLAVWYDLSDVKLAEALDDRASFRRFCGFSSPETTPERTALVRFRKALIARGLDRKLFEVVTAQLVVREQSTTSWNFAVFGGLGSIRFRKVVRI